MLKTLHCFGNKIKQLDLRYNPLLTDDTVSCDDDVLLIWTDDDYDELFDKVEINEINFPDENFRSYILNEIDRNNVIPVSRNQCI